MVYRSGDATIFWQVKYDLHKAICRAKWDFKFKMESPFQSSNSCAVWQGLHTITNYTKTIPSNYGDPILPDRLNEFYGCFDQDDTTSLTDTALA